MYSRPSAFGPSIAQVIPSAVANSFKTGDFKFTGSIDFILDQIQLILLSHQLLIIDILDLFKVTIRLYTLIIMEKPGQMYFQPLKNENVL